MIYPLRNFSVSQVTLFLDCNRKHYLKHVLKLPDPSNEAAQRGVSIHKAAENTSAQLTQGASLEMALAAHAPTDAPWMSYVHALAKTGILPRPGESVATEHRFSLPTHTGVPFIGVIDEILEDRSPVHIVDIKSTSDIRYAKKPIELVTDLQLVTYAHYAFTILDEDLLRASLAYVEAKKVPLKTKLPRTAIVSVDLERDHVRRIWQGELPFGTEGKYHLPQVLDDMIETSLNTDFNDVTPNTSICSKYGGCPYRDKCGLGTFAGITNASSHEPRKRITIQESKTMGFLSGKTSNGNGNHTAATPAPVPQTKAAAPAPAKTTGFLARAQAASKGVAPGPVDEAARQARLDRDFGPAEVPTGVVPPDAPSRMTTAPQAEPEAVSEEDAAPAAETAQEAPKKRGRPPKAKVTGEEAAMDGEPAAPAPKTTKGRVLTLYVDCLPVKGNEAVLFEDWFGTKLLELTSWAEEEEKVPDLRLVGYAKEKAALAIATNDLIKTNRPSGIVISTSNQMAKDVLGVLIPHADNVVRALRG